MSSPHANRDRPPRVSVVVVTFNAADFVVPFLDALDALTYPDLEVIVVDNASRDGTVALVRRHLPAAILIEPGENLGFAAGSNLGAAAAHGDVLLFLNPDTRPPPDTVEGFCLPVWERPEIGAAGCRLVFPDGRIEAAGGLLTADAEGRNRGWNEPDHGQYDAEADVDYATGAALAIRRDVFAAMGGFCPDYFPGFYEDADLGVRLRGAALRVLYLPTPTIVHLEGQSMGRRHDYWMHRNRVLFVFRTAYAAAPVHGLAREASWFWRTRLRPFLAAVAGGHPWKARDAWHALRPATAGEAVGLLVTFLGRPSLAWVAVLWRQLRWVLADLRRAFGGIGHTLSVARRPEPRLGLGILDGAPTAVLDHDNGYRIRLVNDTDESQEMTLHLRGERPTGAPFEATTRCQVGARAAHEIFLVTDWRTRFEIAAALPATDERRALALAPARRTCRLVATLAGPGPSLDRLAVMQPLAS